MSTNNLGSEKFTPLVGYWCLPNGNLNDYDRHVLTDLYLPLLGTEAFSLYLLLWEKLPNKQVITQRKSHAELLSLLGIDLKRFYEARIKAEAIGLIRTFEKKDNLGPYYIYQLFEPMSPEEFFKDDLMSIFLYEQVGENKYRFLVDKYAHSDLILKDSREITKDFLEVFQLSNSDLINTPTEVKNAQNNFGENKKINKPSLNEKTVSQLDWELISDRIQQLFKINSKDLLENQELILNLHAFYGLDEITLIDMIGKTCDIVNNKIDPVRLKKVVQDRFEKNANISVKRQSETIENRPEEEQTNLNRADQLILRQAKSMTPADFLAAQKQKSGGFIGTVESRALRDMAMKTYLPASVLNILVYYILQNSPTLTLPLMETMANDWQQNNIQTPEQALQRINDFQNKPRNPKRRYNSKPKKVEQATDWSKVKAKVVQKDNQSELQKRLKRLRNKDN